MFSLDLLSPEWFCRRKLHSESICDATGSSMSISLAGPTAPLCCSASSMFLNISIHVGIHEWPTLRIFKIYSTLLEKHIREREYLPTPVCNNQGWARLTSEAWNSTWLLSPGGCCPPEQWAWGTQGEDVRDAGHTRQVEPAAPNTCFITWWGLVWMSPALACLC